MSNYNEALPKFILDNPELVAGKSLQEIQLLYDQYIQTEVSLLIRTLKTIKINRSDFIITGSFVLSSLNLIERSATDLDIITKDNYYSTPINPLVADMVEFNESETSDMIRESVGGSSQVFFSELRNSNVKSFKVNDSMTNTKVDFFFMEDVAFESINYVTVLLGNELFKMEKPDTILKLKKEIINLESTEIEIREKHIRDLNYVKNLSTF